MQEIRIEQFMDWFEGQLDKKYADKLQSIRRLFIVFFNLSNQILHLYCSMNEKMEKHTDKEEYKETEVVLSRSIFILSKMIEHYPKCIDSSFCEKFIKSFDMNLNLLCTYYHPLQHSEFICKEFVIVEQTKVEKEKIVEGINKLYNINNQIKEIYRNNANVSRVLALINEYKRMISARIESIKRKTKECKERQEFLQTFEPVIVEFYTLYLQHSEESEPKQQYKKTAIRMFFQLQHQLFSSQLALQSLCKLPLQICEETKEKKKHQNFILQENCSMFSRWLGFLLKPNYSMKNLKKIKVEEMIRSIQVIVKEYPHTNNYLIEHADKNLEEIRNLAVLIIDVVKELEKLEHSGIIASINEYKDGLLSNANSKKYVHRISEYQNGMLKYFQLQEDIKKLKNLAHSTVLQEIGVKVSILLPEIE